MNAAVAHTSAPPDLASRLRGPSGVPADLAPLVAAVLEEAAGDFVGELLEYCSTPFSVAAVELVHGPAGEALFAGPDCVAAVFDCAELDGPILAGCDRAGLSTLVDAMFGGDGSEVSPDLERPLSVAELRVAEALLRAMGSAIEDAFESVATIGVVFRAMESATEKLPRPAGMIGARVALEAPGRSASVAVQLPPAALAPFKRSQAQALKVDATQGDPLWSRGFEAQVKRAEVRVRALFEERMTLDDIASLRVGGILPLEATPRTLVKLSCNDQPLFWCRLGQGDGAYTVRVEDSVDREREIMDVVLSG